MSQTPNNITITVLEKPVGKEVAKSEVWRVPKSKAGLLGCVVQQELEYTSDEDQLEHLQKSAIACSTDVDKIEL